MKKLEGKTALITGCNRGIGRAIMEAFMQEGANIIAATRALSEELELYYSSSKAKYGVEITPCCFDMSEEESIKAAMKTLLADKVQVDILINNAGIADFAPFMFSKMDNIRKTFQINLFGPMLVTQYVVKMIMKQKKGSIVNISSISAIDSNMGNSAYGASKAAIISWTRTLAQELAKVNIRVNAVAPGFIATDMNKRVAIEITEQNINKSALKRLGTPEEVANAVLFLVCDESSYITGQIIRLDGGL